MKNRKKLTTVFALMIMLVLSITANSSIAQTNTKSKTMKDCCMMKDGKMVCIKDGKTMPMEKDMVMENGTKCMVNGECIMKDGTKMQIKEGECIDMGGQVEKCSMMNKDSKKKSEKQPKAMTYTCPMHPEITSDKEGKCPKCGMDLIEKK